MKRSVRMLVVLMVIAAIVALLVILEERSGLLTEGERAPLVTGTLASGERFALADFRDRNVVVLFFYPKDFSQGCTQQVCAFRDNFTRIRDLDGVMFGVSLDDSSSHRRFAEQYSLPYPLIADTDNSISRSFGVLRLGGALPIIKRVTYVIDRQGIIRGVFHNELVIDRHIDDVLRLLARLRAESIAANDLSTG